MKNTFDGWALSSVNREINILCDCAYHLGKSYISKWLMHGNPVQKIPTCASIIKRIAKLQNRSDILEDLEFAGLING